MEVAGAYHIPTLALQVVVAGPVNPYVYQAALAGLLLTRLRQAFKEPSRTETDSVTLMRPWSRSG